MHGWPIIHQEVQYRRKQWRARLSTPIDGISGKGESPGAQWPLCPMGSARMSGGWRR